MTNIRELLKKPKYNQVNEVLKIAGMMGESSGTLVYAVGGVIRDLLMDKIINDIDIMTIGEGIPFAEKLAKNLGVNKIIPFKKFGTALIPYKPLHIEVATARRETYNDSSRKPKNIIFTDLDGDLIRRDFTINALAMDIHSDRFGDLFDPFSGIIDLKNKLIRTPLDPIQTFSDDPLRIMRAAYFASKLDFKIDRDCRKSMKDQANRLNIVSSERIRDEFLKILSTNKPSIGLSILQKVGVLEIVFPEIHVMYGMDQTSEWHHKDIFDHTLQVVDNAAKLSSKMELRFAALVHDIAKPKTRRIDKTKGYTFHGHDAIGEKMITTIAKRMKLSNALKNYLKKLTLLHLRPISLVKDVVTDSAVRRLMVLAGDDLDDLMILCKADITTKDPKKVDKYLKNFAKVEAKMINVLERDKMKAFQSPVRGKEIMSICNITEGKIVGLLKSAIEKAILDGKIKNTHAAALGYLMEIKDNYLNESS